jgi:hypothetical protein
MASQQSPQHNPGGEEDSSENLIASGASPNPTIPINESAAEIVPGVPTERLHTESNAPKLKSTFAQFRLTWLLILCTACLIGFTIFFAYNATLNNPLSRKLILPKASRTILILNALSHVTVLLLQAIASNVFDAARWALAGSNRGPFLSMLSVGRRVRLELLIYYSSIRQPERCNPFYLNTDYGH